MTDAQTPAPVSTNSRLIGLAVLALIVFVVAFVWRRAEGKPDVARIEAARVAARPHFAALERCLLGAPLARGEKPAQRLRNVVLANETLAPDVAWPRRCAPHASALLGAIEALRSEDPSLDRLAAASWSARLALSRGRVPTGADALWDVAKRCAVTGGAVPSGVPPARAPLRPLTATDAASAVLGARQERVLEVESSRFLLAGAAVRLCRVAGTRVACADGPAVAPSVGFTLVPSAPASDSVRPADLVVQRAYDAPDRVVDTAAWTVLGAREKVYAAYSQVGGALVLRQAQAQRGTPPSSIVLESLSDTAATGVELRVPFTLVMPPRVLAGFAYYGYVDMSRRAANAVGADPRGAGVGVAWLPDVAGGRRPAPEQLHLPALPVQVLACAGDAMRVLAFVSAAPTDGDEELPRAVEAHFYDAQGASRAVVRGGLPGSGTVIDCVGEGAALLARKQIAVGGRRSIRLAGLRCSAEGCGGSSVILTPMNDVPDAITLADGRVLLVYRTGAAGGLRARIAPLAELATAREYVISDEAAHGGVESAHRWLVRGRDGALLVLETRAGVVALRVAADGAVTLLRP